MGASAIVAAGGGWGAGRNKLATAGLRQPGGPSSQIPHRRGMLLNPNRVQHAKGPGDGLHYTFLPPKSRSAQTRRHSRPARPPAARCICRSAAPAGLRGAATRTITQLIRRVAPPTSSRRRASSGARCPAAGRAGHAWPARRRLLLLLLWVTALRSMLRQPLSPTLVPRTAVRWLLPAGRWRMAGGGGRGLR